MLLPHPNTDVKIAASSSTSLFEDTHFLAFSIKPSRDSNFYYCLKDPE